MSANDRLESLLSGIFAKTEGVSLLEERPNRSMWSVERVRPRPRVCAPAPSLLLRALADGHKSLLDTPSTKADIDSQEVKHALVLPMRRSVEAQKNGIQLAADNSQETGDNIRLWRDMDSEDDKSKKNIHNASDSRDKNTHPNDFLAKKLQAEGLLNDKFGTSKSVDEKISPPETKNQELKENEPVKRTEKVLDDQVKRLSNTSEDSETQVIIKQEDEKKEKRKGVEVLDPPVVKKRKISPMVFDVDKKVKETDRVRERTESASSDIHVTINTIKNTHKYDSVPPLSAVTRKLVWCRLFPACRYGSACAFAHPRCKFLAACARRNCMYSHSPSAPVMPPSSLTAASHVVPAANYRTKLAVKQKMCKFYPNCVNPVCHFYHPKPCRYGNNCAYKVACKFYHGNHITSSSHQQPMIVHCWT